MKTKITAMLLVLACAPVLAQSDYIDGEFEGRRGWMPDDDRSTECYLGYSQGREEHEDIADMLRDMQEELELYPILRTGYLKSKELFSVL